MAMKRIGVLLFTALLMTACVAPGVRDKPALSKAQQDLSAGIRAYEDGDYKKSTQLLENALSAGLPRNSDKVAAHKYLAFIHCAQSRIKPCRSEFSKALALDPKFELTPAESGHPSWGPVFKSLKP